MFYPGPNGGLNSVTRPPAALGVPNDAWEGIQLFILNFSILEKCYLLKFSSLCPGHVKKWFKFSKVMGLQSATLL